MRPRGGYNAVKYGADFRTTYIERAFVIHAISAIFCGALMIPHSSPHIISLNPP